MIPRCVVADFAAELRAALAREVGGDYYDFFRLGERKVAVLVADVTR